MRNGCQANMFRSLSGKIPPLFVADLNSYAAKTLILGE